MRCTSKSYIPVAVTHLVPKTKIAPDKEVSSRLHVGTTGDVTVAYLCPSFMYSLCENLCVCIHLIATPLVLAISSHPVSGLVMI